jgi:protein-tyrosine-phosphatase
MNQARSVFSHTIIEHLFPEIEVLSSGVEVESNYPNLPGTSLFLSELELPTSKEVSTSISDLVGQNFDLILVAEDWMKSKVAGIHGEILSYEDLVGIPDFMPTDPVGMRPEKFKVELAKVFWVSIRFMTGSGNPRITAVTPEHESLIPKAINFAKQFALETGALLIDAELTVPYTSELKKFEVTSIDESAWNPNTSPSGIALKFQINQNSLKYVVHSGFFDRLSEISKTIPVVMVTAPLHGFSGPLVEPFFTSAIAGDIRLIRQF